MDGCTPASGEVCEISQASCNPLPCRWGDLEADGISDTYLPDGMSSDSCGRGVMFVASPARLLVRVERAAETKPVELDSLINAAGSTRVRVQ